MLATSTPDDLKLTQAAALYMQKILLASPDKIGIRLSVKATGCSGNSYILDLAHQQNPDDQIFENYGVKLFVDDLSFNSLKGTVIDLSQNGLNQRIKFINPNVVSECGCGESFKTS
jgi:iron-sulfur cluster assembly protein